jgi:hypothetical protein
MDKALLLDFNINRPFQYFESFRKALKDMGVELSAISKDDLSKGLPESLEEKFEECSFIVLRKPFAVLSGEKMRGQVQEAVLSGKVGILVLFSFSEMDALVIMNQFLEPFKITTSDFMVLDEQSNFKDTKKVVVFKPEAGAFKYEKLFQGIEQVVIPQPHHLFIQPPAVPVIVGNPTSIANRFYEDPAEQMDGEEIVVSALNEEKGRLLLVDSTMFTNEWLDLNTGFLKNIVDWVSHKQ